MAYMWKSEICREEFIFKAEIESQMYITNS